MTFFRNQKEIQAFLEKKVIQYNHTSFIEADPISVPHRYKKKQDIEIAGLFAAIFAWGNRTTIIRKSNELMSYMDDAPYDFVRHHQKNDLKKLAGFKHRTFNHTDLLYFLRFLQDHYRGNSSLESAFLPLHAKGGHGEKIKPFVNSATEGPEVYEQVEVSLNAFYCRFFSLAHAPQRTRKHIASPEKNSTCKRLNMYLRWMVRNDQQGVDFGIWKKIAISDLICPVDLHVARVARGLGLIKRPQTDWETALELTKKLREMDIRDPVKFDFALFSLGATEKY
jgi:uncharacterized protein (TIGR02757 family)